MPAQFLKNSTAALLRHTVRVFGEPVAAVGAMVAWFDETPAGEDYTISVPCSISPAKVRSEGMEAGLVLMPQDDVTLTIDFSTLPFEPKAEHTTFLLAAAVDIGGGKLGPDPDNRKRYLISRVTAPLAGTHLCTVHARIHT